MIVGGYSLHLYCGNGNDCKHLEGVKRPMFGDFAAHTASQAKAQARKAGWKFKDGDCYCRHCGGKKHEKANNDT